MSGRHDQTEKDRALSFFCYWTTTDRLEFTDWSEVQQRFGSGEIAIFRQGGLTKRVKYPAILYNTISTHLLSESERYNLNNMSVANDDEPDDTNDTNDENFDDFLL